MLFIITFFLIFGWKINFILDISAITATVLAVQYLYIHKQFIFLKRNPPTLGLSLLVLYSIIIVLLTGITDFTPILRSGRALIMLIASFALFNLYKRHYKQPIQKICFHIYSSIIIHAVIMISMYSYAPLRLFIYSITHAADYANPNSPFLEGFRICGLTYGLSQTSLLQIFGLMLTPFLLNSIKEISKKIFIFISFPLILISSILGGRSGLFIYILLLPLYIILKLSISRFSKKNIFSFFKTISICLITFSIIYALAYNYLPTKFISSNLYKCQEIIRTFKLKGQALELLIPMYFLPNDLNTALFGKGNYGRTNAFYILSDVGWIRSIYAIGFIGLAFMVYPFIWGICSAFKQRNHLGEIAIAAIIIFISSMLLNCKELALLTRNQWTIQAILLCILSANNNRESSGI
jgi:hypothetical protein